MNSSTTHYEENSNQCCNPATEFESFAFAIQKKNRLGFSRKLKQNDKSFVPCPISLTPWKMSVDEFSLASETAKVLSLVLTSLEKAPVKLIDLLFDFNDQSSLLYSLKQVLIEQESNGTKSLARNLNLSRFDFMLDKNQQWKLIESNTIAAGMGPFSEKLGRLYANLIPTTSSDVLITPSTEIQASTMYHAAVKNRNCSTPTILFVVEEDEDNVYDQNFLSQALEGKGAKIVRLTLEQLSKRLSGKGKYLQLDSTKYVDLIYYRTGYNIEDYQLKNVGTAKKLIQFRQWTEQHRVVVAPSISHQIASSKWIQTKLSHYSKRELRELFNLSEKESAYAYAALKTRYQALKSFSQVQAALASNNWLLKSQGEGGGNIRTALKTREEFKDYENGSFLMEKIQSTLRSDVCRINQQKLECGLVATSELGIFVFGDNHQYGGYLARSKPAEKVEAGIHSGDGFIDLVSVE